MNKLERLFDLQKFENNDELSSLINETHERYKEELSDEDLSGVNAAGDIDALFSDDEDKMEF